MDHLTITCEHNRIMYGEFPTDELLKIEGISIQVLDSDKAFHKIYKISIDMTDSDELIQDIAFELGMLVQILILDKS